MEKLNSGTLAGMIGKTLLIFLFVFLYTASAIGQKLERTPSFSQYHLVLPITNLDPEYEGDLCIVLRKDQQDIDQLSERTFTIVSSSGHIAQAKITGLTKHPLDLMSNLGGYPIGLLTFTKNGFDVKRTDAMLGVMGKNDNPERIGSVGSIDNFETKYHDLHNFIKQQYPENMQVFISADLIKMPKRHSSVIFAGVEYFDPEEYRKAGDHALHRASYLFTASRDGQIKHLNLKDDLLSDIYTITDMDADGQVEVLVRTSTGFDGTYEIRLLEKDGLSSTKIKLYEWGH